VPRLAPLGSYTLTLAVGGANAPAIATIVVG
jgi:hypothetical protein